MYVVCKGNISDKPGYSIPSGVKTLHTFTYIHTHTYIIKIAYLYECFLLIQCGDLPCAVT